MSCNNSKRVNSNIYCGNNHRKKTQLVLFQIYLVIIYSRKIVVVQEYHKSYILLSIRVHEGTYHHKSRAMSHVAMADDKMNNFRDAEIIDANISFTLKIIIKTMTTIF